MRCRLRAGAGRGADSAAATVRASRRGERAASAAAATSAAADVASASSPNGAESDPRRRCRRRSVLRLAPPPCAAAAVIRLRTREGRSCENRLCRDVGLGRCAGVCVRTVPSLHSKRQCGGARVRAWRAGAGRPTHPLVLDGAQDLRCRRKPLQHSGPTKDFGRSRTGRSCS